jgi:tRNA(Ile)-lysidine synthetase, N-terminal domain/tRNA(Ile)-lysidine synthetase, C-terminal domain
MSFENVIDRLLPWNRVDSAIKKLVEATPGPLCIACSGGPDSMALLLLVRHYWKGRACILLHYNHGIRKASETEESELRRFAEQQNIKIEVGHRPGNVGKTEGELREARYAFFRKMMRLHGASLLFLGHHQDDLFETVLMRLVRGSSLDGLVAPRAIHKMPHYIKVRPLLNFSKKELLAVCDGLGIPYFTDSTNDSDDYLRNRVRHHILGKFDSVFQGINWRKGFAETCSILAMHRDFLKTQQARFLAENKLSASTGACEFYCECALPQKRILLEKWLEKQNLNVRFELMEQIWNKWNSGEDFTVNLDAACHLKCENGRLNLIKTDAAHNPSFQLSWQHGTVFMPNGYTLEIKQEPFSQALYEKLIAKQWDQSCAFVGDAERLQFPLWVRDWRPGDAYCPLGKAHTKKVKELFLAQGITGARKHQLPVICDRNGAIAWIPGLPPADEFKVTGETKMCIFLFYRKA